MKTQFILGNWKSNGTRAMVQEFQTTFAARAPRPPSELTCGLALPFHLLESVSASLEKGAQDVSRFGEGAFTGQIHAAMLTETGCRFCLVGHSERRLYFGESVAHTAEKLRRLQQNGILPVLCIGETLRQRENGSLEEILRQQLSPLNEWPQDAPLVLAYEPVWAIGTGVAATPADAETAHVFIKKQLRSLGLGQTPLLYGGSVKATNAKSLAQISQIDGFLVGGASLRAEDFVPIVEGFIEGKKSLAP